MMEVHPWPRPKLFAEEIGDLAALPDPACLLDAHGTILFANERWAHFGQENGGGSAFASDSFVGTSWKDHVSGRSPRELFGLLLERALQGLGKGPNGSVIQISECNSPDRARLTATRFERVVVSPGGLVGVSLVSEVLRDRPVAEVYAPSARGAMSYRGATGLVVQCSCCRRVRRPDEPDEWDFVPVLVAVTPPDARFDHCPLCLALHGAPEVSLDAVEEAG